MKKVFVGAALGVAAMASPMLAQGLAHSVCPPGTVTAGIPDQARISQDACQQAYDVYQFLAPQLGLALAGGNATIGQGGVLGGIGHFSIGVRGNVFNGQLPTIDKFTQSTNGAQQQTLQSSSQIIGLPTADAAIGLFKGLPLALTNILGVDALVSASYVPKISANNLSVTPDKNWNFGYGARLGLLSESIIVPGVSVTWIERDLPTTSIVGTSDSGNSLQVLDADLKTSAWRLVASKSFIFFGLAAGAGQDHYKQSANISATVRQYVGSGTEVIGNETVPATEQTLTRTNIFADLSINMPIFKIVGEIGQASGGTVNTYNSFSSGRADRSQVYGSAGIRLSW